MSVQRKNLFYTFLFCIVYLLVIISFVIPFLFCIVYLLVIISFVIPFLFCIVYLLVLISFVIPFLATTCKTKKMHDLLYHELHEYV